MKSVEKNKRDSNIELLRIIAACGVIMLHYNNWNIGGGLAYVEQGSANFYFLCGIECLCIGAVDLFMLISGYFSEGKTSFRISKVLALLFQMIVIKAVKIAVNIFAYHEVYNIGEVLWALVPKDYFTWTYIAVNILGPYINICADALGKIGRKKLLILLFVLFSIWPTVLSLISSNTGISLNDLSIVTSSGVDSGYSFINYLILFCIGLCIKKDKVDIAHPLICLFPIYLLHVFWFAITLSNQKGYGIPLSYCNPIVILEVVFVFLAFNRAHDLNSKIINLISKASFIVYLTHNYFIQLFHIKEYVLANIWIMIAHLVFTTAVLYGLGFVIFLVLSPLIWFVNKYFLRVEWVIDAK